MSPRPVVTPSAPNGGEGATMDDVHMHHAAHDVPPAVEVLRADLEAAEAEAATWRAAYADLYRQHQALRTAAASVRAVEPVAPATIDGRLRAGR